MSAENRAGMSVMLTCRDMTKSVAFYRDLGFEMKESWPDSDSPMWCNFVLGSQSLMLGAAMDPEKVGEMCGGDVESEALHRGLAERFRDNAPGAGVLVYLMVPDVDAYAAEIEGRGVELAQRPKSQFYGIRETLVRDPDGYDLMFYTPIKMESCQSCGMPLSDPAEGQMYCGYCTDESGHLRPYQEVLEGTITGYFMGVQKMPRAAAEKAAGEHLAKMPAWAGR